MNDPSGRYDALPTHRRRLPGGEEVVLREPRLVPRSAVDGVHRVAAGERLDHLAARHLGDAYAWWRFADASPGVPVDDLDRAGRPLRLPRAGA